MSDCPCNSNKVFGECCEPIINNQSATTALALMRSRYSAFKTNQPEYIYKTTHPSKRNQTNIIEIEEWAKENNWTKLEIISAEHGKINDIRGIVEFKAYFIDKNAKAQIHHERSTFLKEDDQWYYFDGIFNPPKVNIMKKISRNDPCPCGSGKKHKKCCG